MTEADLTPEPSGDPLDLASMDEITAGAWLAPGRQMVVNDRLVQDRWFAHRVTQAELVSGWLDVVPDFAPVAAFSHHYTLSSGGEVRVARLDAGEVGQRGAPRLVLRGPDGWLDGAPAGGTVLLSVAGSDLLVRWDAPVVHTPVDAAAMTATFQRIGGGHPVPLLDLLLHLLIDQPGLFGTTPAPIRDLLHASGLDVDGTTVHRADVRPAAKAEEAVGVPGLGLESSLAAERLLGAVLTTDPAAPVETEVLAALHDPGAVSALAEQVVGGELVDPDRLELLLGRLRAAVGDDSNPGLAFLHLRLAEWRGDPADHASALAHATRSGQVPAALVDAAWFASDRGDAREASALLRAAHVPNDDPDAQLLARYTASGPRLVGRNEPCWCGSGRKHKQCCLRLNGHDLASRAPWLHAKAVMFLQRPPQRAVLFAVAVAHAGVHAPEDAPARVIAAACDPAVTELCLAEGGVFDRFVDQRRHLLPDDELQLAEVWRGARHRIWDVVQGGRAVRDRAGGAELVLDGPSAAKVARAELVLAAVREGPLALPGSALPIAEHVVDELAPLLDAGEAAPIAAVLGREFGWTAPPAVGWRADHDPTAMAAAP
ncbi:MAG: SEC-C domain-containing protein [Acidimicrobiales bacterium]|nr:SEC-C domain-containing protein [Acidimicrobiales bacterium]